jgi:hypothetical protein
MRMNAGDSVDSGDAGERRWRSLATKSQKIKAPPQCADPSRSASRQSEHEQRQQQAERSPEDDRVLSSSDALRGADAAGLCGVMPENQAAARGRALPSVAFAKQRSHVNPYNLSF